MSETDAPFEVTVWPRAFEQGFSMDELRARTELDSELPVQEMSLEQFFASAIQEQDWHGDVEKEDVRRFRFLKTLISNQLSDIRVLRIGETHLEVLIVGKTKSSDWIALTTQAVES